MTDPASIVLSVSTLVGAMAGGIATLRARNSHDDASELVALRKTVSRQQIVIGRQGHDLISLSTWGRTVLVKIALGKTDELPEMPHLQSEDPLPEELDD